MMSLRLLVAAYLFVLVISAPGSGAFDLFYKSAWEESYLHFNAGQGWNSIPGAKLGASDNVSYPPPWQFIEVPGNAVTWVLTDGNGNWGERCCWSLPILNACSFYKTADNNGGKNYVVDNPGI